MKKILTAKLRIGSLFFAFVLTFVSPRLSKLWAAAPPEATANSSGADLSQSEMRCLTSEVRERGTLDYEIILRNTGSERPENIQLGNSVDTPGVMLASAPGLSYDVEHRLLRWHGTMDPGEERRFTVSLVALPGSAGTMVSNGASIVWGERVRKDLQCGPVEVRSRDRDFAILFTVGGIGLGWLEVVIVGYLLFAPFFVITVPRMVRRREKQRFERSPDVSWHDDRFGQLMVPALSVFFVACIPFVLFFGSMLMEDVRRFVSYERTTCTLLDKKIGHSVGSTGRMKSSIFGPLVSVRYRARGKEIVSTGSPSVSGLTSKKSDSAEKRLARYELGKSYPCWFDPEDPWVFVLTRSPSWGWYLLSVLPVGIFFFSGRYLMRKLRGSDAGAKITSAEIPSTPIQ